MKDTAIAAARAAGKIILDNFLNLKNIDMKGTQDVVTNVDFECQSKIVEIIKEKFPDHEFIGEENLETRSGSEYKWVIDPVDGTINYANGLPIACTSVALMKNDEVILGVVFDPFRDELFFAEKGKGAFLNNNPIQISEKDKLIDCLVGVGGIRGKNLDRVLDDLKKVIPNIRHVRDLGSAALELCYTACGRFDGYFCRSLHLWDCAAASLIIIEAGGRISNFEGIPWNNDESIIASNKNVHEEFLKWLM